MEIRTATADYRPAELVTGPTVTLYRRDVRAETVTDENEDERTMYTYTEYRFPTGQYEMVLAGLLPPGVSEWTETLRRIQRRNLLEEADRLVAEANDHIEVAEDGSEDQSAWAEYRSAVRAYKMAIRATAEAEGFPQTVTYPTLPSQPE